MTLKITSLDHLVLTVQNLEATIAFYVGVLGMRKEIFGEGRVALHFGDQKLNLHDASRPIDPHVRHATPGSSDLCFLTDTPIDRVVAVLAENGVDVIEGPIERTGACGPILSVYCYDPDENLIEIANRL